MRLNFRSGRASKQRTCRARSWKLQDGRHGQPYRKKRLILILVVVNDFAQFDEAIVFDHQIYGALKSNAEGPAYKIARRAEPPVDHDPENPTVVPDSSISLGSEG